MASQPDSVVLRGIVGPLCALVLVGFAAAARAGDEPAPLTSATGIRQISSRHLTLYTDLVASDEINALPALFDQAFPQWCAYFGIDAKQHDDWRLNGCLMKSRERFQAAGLVPADLPQFPNGYARGDWLWFFDQTSPYYRLHLLLHEGTHAFMHALKGGVGSPWFAEGMAELMATHRLDSGTLTLNAFPRSRDEVSKWGRIEIVQTGFAARRALTLAKIFAYDTRAHLDNDAYGWCWAAAAFLDGHPRYQARFRQLHSKAGDPDFDQQVARLFADDRARLNEDWQLFVANLDYGYDFERMNVEVAAAAPLDSAGTRVVVAADRGWQASGVKLAAGATYRLQASGRYQVGQEPRAWECEPGGVTIRYYRGRPLGILLAAVRSDDADVAGPSGLLKPFVVGLETTLQAPRAGALYLRINDSAGSLSDNAGSLDVEIKQQ